MGCAVGSCMLLARLSAGGPYRGNMDSRTAGGIRWHELRSSCSQAQLSCGTASVVWRSCLCQHGAEPPHAPCASRLQAVFRLRGRPWQVQERPPAFSASALQTSPHRCTCLVACVLCTGAPGMGQARTPACPRARHAVGMSAQHLCAQFKQRHGHDTRLRFSSRSPQ